MQKRDVIKGLLACTALTASAFGFAGPDVIVGSLSDSCPAWNPLTPGVPGGAEGTSGQNYGAVVGVLSPNRVFAYAVGTYSCNLAGDSTLTKSWLSGYSSVDDNALMWVDSTAPIAGKTHPVISQNMYKYSPTNNRFTQIGQAWLKHGFCALQGNICLDCVGGGNCDYLYPGCSDPYTSSLNGSQSGLGPKGEVNAATGDFKYDWVNDGVGSGVLFKRLQAKEAELTDATAQFFVSSLYMQVEDRGGAGGYGDANSFNSQSYRSCTINQSNFNMTLTGATQRGKPGIQAWKDIDSSVVLTNVDVPSDGRFIVGSKVVSLGGGQYRYEYAIQNFHSDKSGGSFSVPVGSAIVSSIGFHDVDYHSGDGFTRADNSVAVYDNLDWTNNNGVGSVVTWTCPTPYNALSDSGNALRWDTIYNFWFTCNAAPTTGTATIGLYKGGGTAAASTQIPGTGTGTVLNDNCTNATVIASGTTPFDTTNATNDGPAECVTGSDAGVIGKDIWYLWTNGNCSGTVSVTTCGSTFDTKLAIYNSACPTGPTTNIACNDDSSAVCGTSSLQSAVTFTAAANTTYRVRVGGYDADGAGAGVPLSGTGQITITPPPSCAANDTCATASTAVTGANAFDTTNALTEGLAECASTGGYTNVGKDVWFTWTNGSNAGTATVSTCGSGFDTKVAVYAACPSSANSAIACNDNSTVCGASSVQSNLTFTAAANTQYRIRVGGGTAAVGGAGTLTITAPIPVAPSNDLCANASWLGDGVVQTGDTTNATNSLNITGLCASGTTQEGSSRDVWFKYKPQTTGTVVIETCGTQGDFDTVLSVHSACPVTGNMSLLDCQDDNESPFAACASFNFHTRMTTVSLTAGTTYIIRLGGWNNADFGTYSILVTGGGGCLPPANDNCANRPGIAEGAIPFSTCNATTDSAVINCGGSFQVHNDIWFNYPVHDTGTVTFSLCGAPFNTRMAAYNTGSCSGVNQVNFLACGDSQCNVDDASITLNVTQGNNVTLCIGGNSASDFGAATLNVSFVPATPACPSDLDDDGDRTNGYNPDGATDINDLLSFLDGFEAGDIGVDLDDDGADPQLPDGSTDLNDLLFFLAHFEIGC